MATTARFCSQCGERLKYKRATSLPFSSYCHRCAPRFARVRLWLIAVPVLCAIIGFALGRYSGKREPFYYIGTPVTPVELNHIAGSPERARSGRDEEALTRSPRPGSPSSA